MKYALIIPDGAADNPQAELGGKTPLAAAQTPNMDWIAANGRCGTVRNIPPNLPCGSDVAIMSVLGYDPAAHYTGRAPIEAVAQNIQIDPDEWVFRCNLVTIVDGIMEDYSAGQISNEEAATLIDELNCALSGQILKFHAGVGYRHLMTFRGDCDLQTTPPHDILGRDVAEYLPTGASAERICDLIAASATILRDHEINNVRRDLGENPANGIWLWGQGKMPELPKFSDQFGITGAAITGVDLVRGLAKLIGWQVVDVPGATGYIETDFEGIGAAAVKALDDVDLVCVHIEAPDEAGHHAQARIKSEAIAKIDQHIVGPVLERLKAEGDDWRILVLPDHPTPCDIRTHTPDPVPFAMAGKRVETVVGCKFTEEDAAASDLHVPRGCEMMEFFLTVR